MLSYVTIGTNDLKRAGEFYDAVLAVLGGKRSQEGERMIKWSGKPGTGSLAVITPFDKSPATAGNGTMLSLDAGDPETVQAASLLSVKTGGCPEDCAYCPQSAHYDAGVEGAALLSVEAVVTAAKQARAGGADRFCLGAAWRQVSDGPEFDRVCTMVSEVKSLDPSRGRRRSRAPCAASRGARPDARASGPTTACRGTPA